MTKKIGVDIGGTNLRVGIVKNNKVVRFVESKTPKTQKEFLSELAELISSCFDKSVRGIGIACPGPLKNGFVKNTPNIPLKNFNLRKFIEKKFGKKVVVENDARCVALSELAFGVKKKNFIILTFGTGIGGGIIINSGLYEGKGNAGEMGHMIIGEEKDFEAHWKESKERIKKLTGGSPKINDIIRSKDKKARKIIREVYKYTGEALGSLINIFDPEIIVFMGGAREVGNKFIDGIKSEAKKHVIMSGMPPIIWSKIKHPGILGASLLVD